MPRCHTDDVTAIWRAWGRVLRLPLLVVEEDGTLREISRASAVSRIEVRNRAAGGALCSSGAGLRSFFAASPAAASTARRVHHGEREIIARN